jgi:hypothetical protein
MKYDKGTIMFGVIWGTVSFFLGTLITDVINLIETIADALVQLLIWIILFPLKVFQFIHVDNKILMAVIVIGVAVLAAPIAKRLFKFIVEVLKKLPI